MMVLLPDVASLPDPEVAEMWIPLPPGHPPTTTGAPESGVAFDDDAGFWLRPVAAMLTPRIAANIGTINR
jgi:hypothetical protein